MSSHTQEYKSLHFTVKTMTVQKKRIANEWDLIEVDTEQETTREGKLQRRIKI